MHLSVLASVLVHFAIFVAWPEGRSPTEVRGGLEGSGYLEVVTLASDDASVSAGIAPSLTDGPEEVDETGTEDENTEAGAPDDAPAGWEHLPTNLWRLAGLQAELADTIREQEERSGSAEQGSSDAASETVESDSLRIRLQAAELDLQRLSEEERLSLERLSSYRPQVVLSSPSSWLVVRNPEEVGAFMDAHFGTVRAAAGDGGLIGVAIWVDELGSVEWADIVRSSGDPRVDESALEMFRNVVAFRPARENSARVSVAAIYWLLW
jgi:TonB family protein